MATKTKNRARLSILNEILAFPALGNKDWSACGYGIEPKPGDLVSMNCAPISKYYLSWLQEIDLNNGWPKYLLESIEDGEQCWWENIGLSYYDRERVAKRASWKWNDQQFAFNDRWLRVCYKKNDAYMLLPKEPVFIPDNGVMLDVRVRFGLDNYSNIIKFSDWRKVSVKMMDSYYKESYQKYDGRKHVHTNQSRHKSYQQPVAKTAT